MSKSRRPHPYFGRLNRLEEALKIAPGEGRGAIPQTDPESEAGVLWDRLRAATEGHPESE